MMMGRYSFTIISAILMGLAQHPIGLGFFALFALVPIFFVLEDNLTFRDVLSVGFVWGFVYNIITVYWIAFNIGTSPMIAFVTMILSVLVLSANTMLIFIVWNSIRGYSQLLRQFMFALIWCCIEYVRSFGSLGFPWISIANTQTDYLTIIQNAELVGIYGITFWIISINISICNIITQRNIKWILITCCIFIIPMASGSLLKSNVSIGESELTVSVVQPNMHLSEKRKDNMERQAVSDLLTLSSPSIDKDVDLVVWPETSVSNDRYNIKKITSYLDGCETKIVAGVTHYERLSKGNTQHYNSISFIDETGVLGIYNKLHLVPMAERVPFSNFFGILDRFNIGIGSFSQGSDFTIFSVSGNNFASMVCFESTFPHLSNRFVRDGASFLVYVVNDGWYETAPEPQQHAKQAIFRAIETRRPVVRSANTGISMVIDQFGNIQRSLELNQRGVIEDVTIFPSEEITFYVRYGDYLIYIMMIILLYAFARSKIDEKKI